MFLATGLKAGYERSVFYVLRQMQRQQQKTTTKGHLLPLVSDVSRHTYTGELLRQSGSRKLLFMRSNLKITSIYSAKFVLINCWSRKENKAVKSMINTYGQINSINSKNRLHSTLVRTLKWQSVNHGYCKYVWNVVQRML